MPTTVSVTQVQPIDLQDNPVAPVQVQVEQVQPVQLIPLHQVGGSGTRFIKILGSVYSATILQAEHGLSSILGLFLLKPTGEEVSVLWMVTGSTVSVYSNVNLNNHKLIIL